MGMFTTIIDGPGGPEYQIKCGCGYDELERYHLGDEVAWYVDSDYPGCGKLLDGFYNGTASKQEDDCRVVIKGHRVVAIEPISMSFPELQAKYQIKPPLKSWWTAKAWERQRKRERRAKLELRRGWRWLAGKPCMEAVALVTARMMRWQMRRPGFARRILPPVAL